MVITRSLLDMASASTATHIQLGNCATDILDGAFSGYTNITEIGPIGSGASVEIPDSLTTISGNAFRDCTNLTSVTIGSGVTSLDNSAFSGCTNLSAAHLNSDAAVNNLVNDSFRSVLTAVTIGDSVQTIGDYAFSGCSSLPNIEIPNSVRSLGNGVFRSCSHLTSIEIPSSVRSIGNSAFYWCTGLTSITVEALTPPTLGTSVFASSNCPIYVPSESYDLYINAENWSSYADRIAAIEPPYKLKYALEGNVGYILCNASTTLTSGETSPYSAMTSAEIGDCVQTIGGNAFWNYTSLTSIEIPSSVRSIGNSAFYWCTGLTSITVEALTPPTLGTSVFASSNCPIYIPCNSTDAYTADANWNEYASRFVEYGCSRVPDGYTKLQYCTVPKVSNTSQSFMVKSKNNVAYNYTISFMPIGWETNSYYKFPIGGNEDYPPASMFVVFSLDNGWSGGGWIINGLGYTMDSRKSEFKDKTRFHDNANAIVTMCYNERQENNGIKVTIENEGYDTYTGVSTTVKTGSGTKVDYNTEYDIPLFTTYNRAIDYTPNMRFYNFKVYDTVNKTDVYHYVPVKRDSDNKVGICDIVSQNVYFPPTHIVLTAGPQVEN